MPTTSGFRPMHRGELVRTENGYEARFERSLDHPVDKVWQALTDPEHLARWIYPDELGELAEVGHGLVDVFGHEVVEEDPRHLLVHGPPDAPESHTIRWELTETREGGTRLVLTHSLASLTDEVPQHMAGWHVHLDVLQAILAGGRPEDHTPYTMTMQADGGVRFEEDGQGAWARFPDLRRTYSEALRRTN